MRQRHTYSKSLKAQVVQECLQPGVSVSSVALRHGINANIVRRWLPPKRNNAVVNLPAFVPLQLAGKASEIGQHRDTVRARGPDRDMAGVRPVRCARFVRGLTR